MNQFNFERKPQETQEVSTHIVGFNGENTVNLVKSIPTYLRSYGYIEPHETVFNFLKNSALPDFLNENIYASIKTFNRFKTYDTDTKRRFGIGPKYHPKRVLTQEKLTRTQEFYDGKQLIRYTYGTYYKDDLSIQNMFYDIPSLQKFEEETPQWAQKIILGDFTKTNQSDIKTFYDLYVSKMFSKCSDGKYDFLRGLKLISNMQYLCNMEIAQNNYNKLIHTERTSSPVTNFILASTPLYTLEDLRKYLSLYHNNQIFINFILLGHDFTDQFVKDLKICADHMENVRLIFYTDYASLNDRQSFFNDKKMIDYLSTTQKFNEEYVNISDYN